LAFAEYGVAGEHDAFLGDVHGDLAGGVAGGVQQVEGVFADPEREVAGEDDPVTHVKMRA